MVQREIRKELTKELVRSLFDYNEETGDLIWKVTRNNKAQAGMRAGSLNKTHTHHVYKQVVIDYRTYVVSWIIWLWKTGEWPEVLIDHKDGNPLNNRWDNLRLANKSQNGFNRGPPKSNTTGFKGVYKHRKSFVANIWKEGKKYHLGSFPTPELAYEAYCDAALVHHGEFARLS